jgi:hypothetical protein
MGTGIDLSRLPIGDGHLSQAPQRGAVWACGSMFRGGGAAVSGPWLRADGTFDLAAKPQVAGAVTWPHTLTVTRDGPTRVFAGNGLPGHATGTYPVAADDPAARYDPNPNRIAAQEKRVTLPADPVPAAQPACVPMGAIGVLLTGSVFFTALDGQGRDAVAHELQDGCGGHPQQQGVYHYHNLTGCLADPGNGLSALLGYAYDGFGLYGHHGEGGATLTNADLDACHGHRHALEWDGQTVVMYHYHATHEYPYTVGCFVGTPVQTGPGGPPGAMPPGEMPGGMPPGPGGPPDR